jgi:hypothetical protein
VNLPLLTSDLKYVCYSVTSAGVNGRHATVPVINFTTEKEHKEESYNVSDCRIRVHKSKKLAMLSLLRIIHACGFLFFFFWLKVMKNFSKFYFHFRVMERLVKMMITVQI